MAAVFKIWTMSTTNCYIDALVVKVLLALQIEAKGTPFVTAVTEVAAHTRLVASLPKASFYLEKIEKV